MSVYPGHYKLFQVYPRCSRGCGREAESKLEGALCHPCRQSLYNAKRRASKLPAEINESRRLLDELYQREKRRFQPLYGVLNRFAKAKVSPALILAAMRSLHEKETAGKAALEPLEYFAGTMRKLQMERDAKRLREGKAIESVKVLDMFADILRRSGYKVEK
jgi:hypothetical protein